MRHSLVAAVAVIICSLAANAFALPTVPKHLGKTLAEPENQKFAQAFGALKSKCDTCHIPGADKKAKGHGLNDFGHAMHDNLKVKEFKQAVTNKDDDAAAALIKEAWGKASEAKNEKGEKFGDAIKEGKLPGKNE